MEYFDAEELKYYEKFVRGEKKAQKQLLRPIRCKDDKFIGNGSFGTVTRGFDRNNKLTMAIKRIQVNKLEDSKKNIEFIEQEVNVLKELRHPNIVKYYGFERDEDFLKIYLEFVDMGSISTMLKNYGPFPEPVVIQYTKQILQGLEYLHYHGLIH